MAEAQISEESVISEETSRRICDHMNEDHAVSVYAMGKRKIEFPPGRGWKISKVSLQKVTLQGAELQVFMCRDNLCQDAKVTYHFEPPLQQPSQIRSKMIAVHQNVCSPISCYEHALFPAVLVFFASTSWFALGTGAARTDPALENTMKDCFHLLLFGHTCLALYGTYWSRSQLKLPWRVALKWFIAIFLSGWLAFKELQDLLEFDQKGKDADKQLGNVQ
jgi:Protein of unknown function (DUF2470)